MQAPARAVLPPVSTLLSQLKPLSNSEDEGKAAHAPESGTSKLLRELYNEIKQQDSEHIFSGDSESEWGAEIAAEIRCSLPPWPSSALVSLLLNGCSPSSVSPFRALQCLFGGCTSPCVHLLRAPSCFTVFLELLSIATFAISP